MQRVIDCLTLEHDFRLTLMALLVCALGAGLSTRLYMRTHSVYSSRAFVQLGLTSFIAGTAVWATHFLAMLAYEPPAPHAYDLMRTGLSLVVAIVGIGLSFATLHRGKGAIVIMVSGALFGASVSTMHYLGMWAYLVEGTITFHTPLVIGSIVAGMLLGALTMHRLTYPVTRFCWVGAAAAMILSVSSIHFLGMGALTITANPTIVIPDQLVSDTVMGAVVIVVTLFLLVIGFGSFLVEVKIAEEMQTLLRKASLHDPLTQLPNRANLQAHLQQRVVDPDAKFAVVTIDVDRFRSVNVRFGNKVGDQLLLELATRLKAHVGPNDYLARAGSDEFVIIHDGETEHVIIQAFVNALLADLRMPFASLNHTTDVSASIGTACCPKDANVPHDLLQKSQYAMKQAKANPEQRVSHYDATMDEQTRERDALTADLRQALSRDEFFLHFQPQNDIMSQDIVGFEVLCRWRHPTRGIVPPSIFIPIAEDIGMIKAIGIWVLKEACNEAVRWNKPYRIAVNVAPKQLDQPDFIAFVDEVLATSGLDASRLELEITEASIIDDKTDVLDVMRRLKARGISIAMDDFGTGYSSLASLQAFPFDKIKIDRSFVKDVHENDQRAAIVRATLLLGAALDIPVLAEGIENLEELAFLRNENCSVAQGFFFGKPMPVDDVRALTGGIIDLKKTA